MNKATLLGKTYGHTTHNQGQGLAQHATVCDQSYLVLVNLNGPKPFQIFVFFRNGGLQVGCQRYVARLRIAIMAKDNKVSMSEVKNKT